MGPKIRTVGLYVVMWVNELTARSKAASSRATSGRVCQRGIEERIHRGNSRTPGWPADRNGDCEIDLPSSFGFA